MPRKIVIDARESGTSTGRYVDKLIEYLHKLEPGYDITVLTKTARLEFMKTIAPSFKVVESNYKEFNFAEQIGFLRQLQKLKADLVHFGMTQQPIFYRGKVVTAILDLTTARFRNPAKNWLVFTLKQWVYRFVIKYVARKSSRVITISNFTKKDIAQYAKIPSSKISVIYPAANKIAEPTEKVAGLEPNYFLMYVGRPLPHKNLKRLIEAFVIVRQTRPELKLVLAGKNDILFERIKKWAAKKQIKGLVFTGFVSEGQLRWLYENTATYVFPSLGEGFGLPGLEAMVHGAPVVSSNATCLPEIYKDGAIYFDPRSTNEMTEKIKLVLEDKTLAAQLRQKGPKVAAGYSWERTAEQTLALYEQVLKGD